MVRGTPKAKTGNPAVEAKCRHHWVIESPAGPKSKGFCRCCGAKGEFETWLSSPSWREARFIAAEVYVRDTEQVQGGKK